MTAYDHLLAVDLGHRAGPPPPRPYVSEATKEQVRLTRWLELTADVRDALTAGIYSLDRGRDPGHVARATAARLAATTDLRAAA